MKRKSEMLFFLCAAIIIIALSMSSMKSRLLESEAQSIISGLVVQNPEHDNGIAVVLDGKVNKERLAIVAGMPYTELKSMLGTKADFAVYFVDDEGNAIPIGSKTCIGSPEANVSGMRCS